MSFSKSIGTERRRDNSGSSAVLQRHVSNRAQELFYRCRREKEKKEEEEEKEEEEKEEEKEKEKKKSND
ncbi:hypothetical protein ElyMa_005680200 [Elysia marginata]|uniref:Uncharacterized protein n=1 Tax=Elysia marginata TaxID=1093978 RepID=A0AAV4FE35_9GAST|nr:hypothetical protein ElyMa_005680200 [Elysia marginata]